MSELSNPLFENERDFLERQKEEYKHALMGDVDHIKSQGQEIGKKVAIAGGVLLAGYLLKRMFGGGKKKTNKVKKTKTKKAGPPVKTSFSGYNSIVHEQEDGYTLSSERMPHAEHHRSKAVAKGFLQSDLGRAISQQVMALLMVYITKKVEEYLSSVSENNDIAAKPHVIAEIETTEYIVPEENAF